jgi:multisubunit Na+/H+ antiporter MnhF subunit
MITIIPFVLIAAISIVFIRFFFAQNTYEKIAGFYFIFTNIIILIMVSSIADFESILDIIIILFLVKLMAVLFLIFNRKKI